MKRRMKSLALYAIATVFSVAVVAAVLFWKINPARITIPEEVEYEAFQTLGARPGKMKMTAWLRAHGFEIDETDYQKNGNVVAILRDTKWGIAQTDIYLSLWYDYSKIGTNNPQCLGHSIEERTRIL